MSSKTTVHSPNLIVTRLRIGSDMMARKSVAELLPIDENEKDAE